jgi:hypothetical protein
MMIKKFLTFVFVAALALGAPAGTALAGSGNPAGTGQPSVECDEFPTTPGHSSSSPGSPFNEDGTSGDHYAGEQPQNSNNAHSVSQYDIACAHQ